jgi:hypothetical protein
MFSYVQRVITAACLTTVVTVSAASANCGVCGSSTQPGLLAYLFGTTGCTPCPAGSGDYMVNQGPVYSGPAVIAPPPTYAPTPTASGYPYVYAQGESEAPAYQESPVYRDPPRRRVSRVVPVHRTVHRHAAIRQVASARKHVPVKKGGPQFIRARAEVRIYNPQRMDIRLFR